MKRLPKVTGRDTELGNFVEGVDCAGGTGSLASRLLLAAMPGHRLPSDSYTPPLHVDPTARGAVSANAPAYNPRDWGRKFQATHGGCYYIDLCHLELCLPETLDAFSHVARYQAMLRQVRQAQVRVNETLSGNQKVVVLVNNSDGLGHSYGGHLNFLISREAYSDLFDRRLQRLLWLTALQVSSILFTGQGKVGSENGAPAVRFQLTQRGDFFEQVVGKQTTYARPIVNARDESLCVSRDHARLHSIFLDSCLCPLANVLEVGVMQIALSMLEAQRISMAPLLNDPLTALQAWGHDPTLTATALLLDERRLTAVEHQLLIFEQMAPFVEAGECDEFVPQARRILLTWGDVLQRLKHGELNELIGKLDWVTKQAALEGALASNRSLEWNSPKIKMLDHLYSSLDDDGLFNIYAAHGLIEQVVDESQIANSMQEPPEDTRAWTRAKLLRAAERCGATIHRIDWDLIEIDTWDSKDRVYRRRRLEMPHPLSFPRHLAEPVFESAVDLDQVMQELSELANDTGPDSSFEEPQSAAITFTPTDTANPHNKCS